MTRVGMWQAQDYSTCNPCLLLQDRAGMPPVQDRAGLPHAHTMLAAVNELAALPCAAEHLLGAVASQYSNCRNACTVSGTECTPTS